MADTIATLTSPRANATLTTDITAQAREMDFVTRFSKNWSDLRAILGVARPIRKAPGTRLVAYKAAVTLENGNVTEGAIIPYSQATVTEVAASELKLLKYAKAVSIEAVNTYGAAVAVQKTDSAFLSELQGVITDELFSVLSTGSMTDTAADFQAGVALAVGSVKDKFKKLHLDASNVVVFVNTMDAYRYLGAANLTVQNTFGIEYVQSFMGATIILSSELEEGKVIATAADNLNLYYIDPADGDFAQLGLRYTVDGETNLIGFHVEGNYGTAVGETFAVMGAKLWPEYLDGVAVVTVGG